MREKKYHLYLTADEQSKVIQSLIDLKNNLIAQGRYGAGGEPGRGETPMIQIAVCSLATSQKRYARQGVLRTNIATTV